MFDVDGTFNWGPGNTGSTVSLAYGGLNATTGAGKMVLSGEFALNRFLTINASQPTVLIPGAATGLKISAPAAIPYQLLLESASNTSQLIMGANTSGFGASILAVRTDSPFTTPLFLQPNGSALVIGTSTYDAAGAPVQITPITQFKAVGASVLFDTGGYISPTNSGLGTIEIRDGANLQLILSKTATTRFGNLGVNSNNQMQVSCFRSDAPYVCDTSINPDGGSLFVGSGTTCSVKMCLNGALKVSSATMIASATSFTNGAAAAAGTLLNAPVAGNPTKWIPVDDNGTTRYIPTW
jgi:hypothetical protein